MSTRRTASADERAEGPDPIYWRITIDLGAGVVEDMGGTVYTEEQAREQASRWLAHYADKIGGRGG